ncbi:uncharacterized protein LOC126481990 [Schistocerca serialis cubense]|uniref:uncharacterized protein LOC126481990 n=1 Tax=Schistocerca serialis cubense TaxID=2023355 RepID=UPI00214F11E5|nr:uncharacterized protein LOC126481990 [Schistocerca serialis cubense]
MFLSRCVYLENLLKRLNRGDCKPCKILVEVKSSEDTFGDMIQNNSYTELIGCLMYVMTATRQDIIESNNYLSRHQYKPIEFYWKSLKRILQYIKVTFDVGLCYKKGSQLLSSAMLILTEQVKKMGDLQKDTSLSFWKYCLLGYNETYICFTIFSRSIVYCFGYSYNRHPVDEESS